MPRSRLRPTGSVGGTGLMTGRVWSAAQEISATIMSRYDIPNSITKLCKKSANNVIK